MSGGFEQALGPLLHVVGGIATERLERLWRWLQRHRDRTDIEEVLQAEATRAHPGLYEYLDFRLEKRPVMIAGQPARLMKRRLKERSLIIPVSLLMSGADVRLAPLRQDTVIHRENDWEQSAYVKTQRLLAREIQDNVVFTAQSIELHGNDAIINGGLSTYGSCLATQDALEWELLVQASRNLPLVCCRSDFPRLSVTLTHRIKAEDAAGNYLLCGRGRHNALGVSTAIVYRSPEGGYRVLVGKRSAGTCAHADLFHVIPAGMFQPELGQLADEWDVLHGVLKEYGEELFNERLNLQALGARYFYKEWTGVRKIRKALAEGKCIFQITGLIVNLLNLRPELCALLLVNDADWWESQHDSMKTNWEYAPRGQVMAKQGKAQSDFRLDTIEQEFLDYFGCTPDMWVPPGLGALWLGVDAARKQLRLPT